jgi:hypothetical protein
MTLRDAAQGQREEKMMQTDLQSVAISGMAMWAGRIISGLVVVFLFFDGAIILIPLDVVIETSAQLGIPAGLARTLGVLTLVSTILYVIPRTSVLGAILLTGYSAARSSRICASAARSSPIFSSGSISA